MRGVEFGLTMANIGLKDGLGMIFVRAGRAGSWRREQGGQWACPIDGLAFGGRVGDTQGKRGCIRETWLAVVFILF